MLTIGPNLGLLDNGEYGEGNYYELLRLLRGLDLLVMPHVKSMLTQTPPTSPAEGDAYIIPSGATGVWAGKTHQIARWTTRSAAGTPPNTPTWEYFTPKINWQIGVDDVGVDGAIVRFNGTEWVAGGGGGSYLLPPATDTVLGGVKVGAGLAITFDGVLSVTTATYVLPVASDTVLGGVKQGSNVTIGVDGTLTVNSGAFEVAGALTAHTSATDPHSQYLQSIPTASDTVLGGVKVGTGLSIDVNGVLSSTGGYTLPTASDTVLGGIKVGTGLSIDVNGVLSSTGGYTLPVATNAILGGVKQGANVNITEDGTLTVRSDAFEVAGALSGHTGAVDPHPQYLTTAEADATYLQAVPMASDTILGGIKVGTGLSIDVNGVLSASGGGYTLPVATDTVLGGVKQGSNITIGVDGTLTVNSDAFEVAGAVGAHEGAANPHSQYLQAVDNPVVKYPTALKVGNPTHIDDLQEVLNHLWSSGVTDGWDLTDNGNGTVNLSLGSGMLRASASGHVSLYSVELPAVTNLALTDGAANYIYADWNAGSPAVGVTTSKTGFNCLDKCIAWKVVREGTKLYIVDARAQNVDGNRLMRRLFLNFAEYIPHAGGTILSATGTRNIAVSAGGFSFMVQDIPHSAFDTSVAGTDNQNVISLYKHVSGAWTRVANEKQIDNANYDNGTDLIPLSNNSFGVRWIYALPNTPTSLAYVIGNVNSGNISVVESVAPPSVSQLPPAIAYGGVLIGRIIIEKSAASFYSIQTASTVSFGTAGETMPITDSTSLVKGSADGTKQMRMEADGITTGTTRVVTLQDKDLTMAGIDVGQTFTKPQKAGTLALTSSTGWDGSLATGAQHLTATVNGSLFTIANPTAQESGMIYLVNVAYTTSHSIAWGDKFKGLTGITATATAGAEDTFAFRSNGTNLVRIGHALNGAA